jgi:hypothetical protein
VKNNKIGLDNSLRIPDFHGLGSEDLEKHLFVCE